MAADKEAETPCGQPYVLATIATSDREMSAILSQEILKRLNFERFKSCVRVDTNHCLEYIRRQGVTDKQIVLTAHLPYECVRIWSAVRQEALSKQIPCCYISIFNAFLHETTGFKVKSNSQRLEERLRKVTSETKSKFVGKNGKAYRALCEKQVRVSLQMDDLETLAEAETRLSEQKLINNKLQEDNHILQKDNQSLQERLENLVKNMSEAQEAGVIAEGKILDLEQKNRSLEDYIKELGQDLDFRNNGYKNLSDIGERQWRRKLTEVRANVQKALWFSKTFGLELDSVRFKDDVGASHTCSYSDKTRKSYKNLSEADQQKVKNVLFILDKFCVGEEAYHELSMIDGNDGLPRSYLIKQCKDDLNKLCHITATPGSAQGAQLDFLQELKSVVQKQESYVISITVKSWKLLTYIL